MNTATLTIEQQQEVAKLLKGFDTITEELEAMAIRLVIGKEADRSKPVSTVERRGKCPNGHYAVQNIDLDIDDDGNYIKNQRGFISGHACCTVCDADFYCYIRLTNND